jgi:small conductance mechanosensitive channel
MFYHLLAQVAGDPASDSVDGPNQPDGNSSWLADLKDLDWVGIAEKYGLQAATVIILLIAAWILSIWASALVRRSLARVRFDETLTKFLAKMVRWVILLFAMLACLSKLGVETSSFAVVLGAAGLAIGLAFQATLSNFAAGGMLLIFRPYKVGDAVNAANVSGSVNEIALFTTEIDTWDGRRIIVPNSAIYGSVIENIWYHPRRRIDVEVGVSYDAEIDVTRQVLEKALQSVPQIVQDPEPAVVLNGLGASSVDWVVKAWANRDDFLTVKQGLIRAVKMELDEAGIGIPYPQMDVHLDPPADGNDPSSAAT